MKAAVLNAFDGRFDIEDIQIDSPRDREVLVQVKASGLCHSDIYLAENQPVGMTFPLPAILGHEIAGIVLEVGRNVVDFAVGDHVVASGHSFCGHCNACFSGRAFQCDAPEETLRPPAQGSRLSRNGQPVTNMAGTSGFAEFALVHENQLAKVPKELPFPQAAILGCATITGAGAAINTAAMRPGDTVAVIGVGGIGLNIISGARLAGARRIIAIDPQDHKEELIRKFGATDFINPENGDTVAAVRALVKGGVDHAFEVVGLKSTSEQAIHMLRRGGTAYMIGMHKPGSTISVDVVADLIFNHATIKGVYSGSTNIKHDIPMYADLYLQGRFNLDDLISHEINISEINDEYQRLKKNVVARSVITSF